MFTKDDNGIKWDSGSEAHSIPADILEQMKAQRGGKDNKALLKLFTPDAGATWKLSEVHEQESGDIHFFGMCDLGLGFAELGYVSLMEITGVKGALGLAVERDLYYSPEPVSELI